MPALKNHKHELFAGFVAKGERPARAYALAGYQGKGSDQSASRLLKTSLVRARVVELRESLEAPAREEAIARATIDREYVLSKLKVIAEDHARDNPGASVRALELLGKEIGMFRDPRGPDASEFLEHMPMGRLQQMIDTIDAMLAGNRPMIDVSPGEVVDLEDSAEDEAAVH